MEIGKLDRVAVADGDLTHARCGQIAEDGTPEASGTNDQHLGRGQLLLPLATDLRQKEVMFVARCHRVLGPGGAETAFTAQGLRKVISCLEIGADVRRDHHLSDPHTALDREGLLS